MPQFGIIIVVVPAGCEHHGAVMVLLENVAGNIWGSYYKALCCLAFSAFTHTL